MSEIVHLAAARTERQQSQDVLWQRFVDAQRIAQSTLKLEDGIAAGKAYAAFVESFVGKR
jgi:hypothetical protein